MKFSRIWQKQILCYDKDKEKELMIVISQTIDLYLVSKEIEDLYLSMSPSLWYSLQKKSAMNFDKNESGLLLEDIFSDGWYRILVKRDQYDRTGFPFPWSKRIMINVLYNIVKSYYEKNKINVDDFTIESKESVAIIKNSSNELVVHGDLKNSVQQKWQLVMQAVESELTPPEKNIFIKLAEGMKQRDICKELGISEGNFSKIKKKILSSVRLYFERNNIDIEYD
jgi:RNA polymerase sigma factor (sigma-70 family)